MGRQEAEEVEKNYKETKRPSKQSSEVSGATPDRRRLAIPEFSELKKRGGRGNPNQQIFACFIMAVCYMCSSPGILYQCNRLPWWKVSP